MDVLTEKVVAKVKQLTSGTVTLQLRRDAAGNVEVPTGATCGFMLDFTIPELRECGCKVVILTEDGREMTDDEYASALQAEIKRRG